MSEASLLSAALNGTCPHCGERSVFDAPAQVANQCSGCGLDLAALERGGRISGLLTLAVAALLITAALAVEEYIRPPLWVHLILWAPLTIGAVLGALRLYKVAGIYREYERLSDTSKASTDQEPK